MRFAMPTLDRGPKRKAKDEDTRPRKKVLPVKGAKWMKKHHPRVLNMFIALYPRDATACEIGEICEHEHGGLAETYRKRARELAGWGKLVMFREKRRCLETGDMANVYRWKFDDWSKNDKLASNGEVSKRVKRKGSKKNAKPKRNKRRKLRSVS